MTEQTTHIRIPRKSLNQLKQLAELERRSITQQIAVVVEDAYRAEFDVVAVGELPHPEDAEPVKIVYVQRRDPA